MSNSTGPEGHSHTDIDMQPAGIVTVESMFGPVFAFEDDLITQQLRDFGAHTRNEVALLKQFVAPGDFIYDIGAHIGTFAIPLAQAVGSAGLVVAIEADQQHFQLLWKNLSARNLANEKTVINAAIANDSAHYSVTRVAGNTGASYLSPSSQNGSVDVYRLDSLHQEHDHSRQVACIKLDVEGMELSALRSGAQLLGQDHPLLYVEISLTNLARYGATIADLEELLRSHGYSGFFVNIGDRNSTNDHFTLKQLGKVADGGSFFDLLAIHSQDERLNFAQGLAV